MRRVQTDQPLLVGDLPDHLGVTLSVIGQRIVEDSQRPERIVEARRIAARAARGAVDPRDRDLRIMRAIWHHVWKRIEFVHDPWHLMERRNIEVLANSEALERMGAGDCDEHVVLSPTLTCAAGLETELWVGGFGEPQHIWSVCYTREIPALAVNVDTTLRFLPFGVRPGNEDWTYWQVQFQ